MRPWLGTAVLAGSFSLLPLTHAAPADAQPSVVPAKAARPAAKRRHFEPGLVATLPGFEMLPDGGSRFYVELSHATAIKERRDARGLAYVISGAHVVHRNNENPLVTVHFNTPVSQARLVPAGRDLLFAVELRADAAPTWRLTDGEDGASVLQVDFPAGAFLPNGEGQAVAVVDEAPAPDAPRQRGARVVTTGQGVQAVVKGNTVQVTAPAATVEPAADVKVQVTP